MELDESVLSSSEQRLPSTRPLDRRWDRSRGIIFAKALRPVVQHRTWAHEHGLVFAETPASQRGYASRPMVRPEKPGQQIQAQERSNRQADVLNNPNWTTAMRSDHPLRDLERERKGREEDRAAHKRELQAAEAASRRQIQEIKEELSRREGALQSELKQLERRRQEYLRQAAERDRDWQQREQDWKTKEEELTNKEQSLATTIADVEEAANRRVEPFIKGAQDRAEQADADARRYQIEYHDKMERLQVEQAEELRKQEVKLERDMNTARTNEMRVIRAARIERLPERATYDAYHSVWAKLRDSSRLLSLEFSTMNSQPFSKADCWSTVSEAFDGELIHPWFPHRYAQLNSRLQNLLQTSSLNTRDAAEALLKARRSFSVEWNEVSRLAHNSRALTRYHKLEPTFTDYATISLANRFLNDEPIREQQASIDAVIEQTKKQAEQVDDASTRQSLEQKLLSAKRERSAISDLLAVFVRFREMEALKALRRDTFAAKEVFFLVQEPKARLEEAREQWDAFKDKYPVPERDDAEGTSQRYREQFVDDFSKASTQLTELETLVRKRRLLQSHLGIEDEDEAKYEAEIDRRIAEVSSAAKRTLEALVSGGASGSRFYTSLKSPATPAFTRTRLSAAAPSGSASDKKRQVERNDRKAVVIRKQPSKLDAGSGEERKDSKQSPQESPIIEGRRPQLATLSRKRLQLADLIQKKAELLQTYPGNVVEAEEVEKQIQALKVSISTAVIEQASSRLAKTAPQANASTSAKGLSPQRKRNERRARKKSASKSSARDKSDATSKTAGASSSNQDDEGSGGGRVNFKPTIAYRASRPYWPTSSRYFQVKNRNADSSLQASARPPLPDDFYNASFSEVVPLTEALHNASLLPARGKGKATHVQARLNASSDSFEDHQLFDAASEIGEAYEPLQSGIQPDQAFEPGARSDQSSDSEPPTSQTSDMPLADASTGSAASSTTIESGSDFQATYRIPPADYRDALVASKSTTAAFWSHKLYKNEDGKHPAVHYCTSYEQAEAQAKRFVEEPVIGFDIEWEPSASYGKSKRIKEHVSLIQIAAEDKIALFHVAMFTGDTVERLMPPSLRAILESKAIAKVGVNIRGDATRMRVHLQVDMKGIFELSRLYNVVEYSETAVSKVNNRLVALDKQVMAILGLPLKKEDHVRQSAWARKLRVEQSDYAASDAYAGYQLYRALEAKRLIMDPTPPRPAFHEDGQPLQLGNGVIIRPKPFVPRKKRAAVGTDGKAVDVEDEDEEGDEYFDAVEDMEEDQGHSTHAASASGGVLLSGINVTYPTLPQRAESQLVNGNAQQETEPTVSSTASTTTKDLHSTKKRERRPSTEFDLADTWATTWRTENGPKLNPQTLRAYQLWHWQSFDCKAIARLLGDPPLRLQTVAQYVMSAIHEGLPFDVDRVREPLEILPKSVHRRYWKVLERIEEVAI